MNDSRPPKPKLRWYQYQLRSLLVLIVVLCLGFGWLGGKIRRIVSEKRAAPLIQAMGGRILYGIVESPNFRTKLQDEMSYTADESLRKMLSIDHSFANWVDLDDTDVADEDFDVLDGLSYLEYLSLNNTQITDAGLPHLYKFEYLQIVDLRNTQVTTEGVDKLKLALPKCEIMH